MSFGDLKTATGLEKLNEYLLNNSFVSGTEQSKADVETAEQLSGAPDAAKYPNIARWYKTVAANADLKQDGGDDDEVDLFGSDEDDVDEEAEKVKQQRLEEYKERKAEKEAKKGKTIAKSAVTLDVKGWDDETDMEELTRNVLNVNLDGLTWGGHKYVPVGFGINKLQINCIVEDDKVLMDDLAEAIEADEDHVQSVDVAAMQKL